MTAVMQDGTRNGTRDGTDADALPPIVEERRWLYLNVTTWQKILAPLAIGLIVLGLWEFVVWKAEVPYYILPGPWRIFRTLITDWGTLSGSLAVTLQITGLALLAAVLLGGLLSILFTQSKWLEFSLFPYAIILQVTPIVAIAPLIIIWVNDTLLSLLICAWIVAFFPILSNTILGLNSADHNLINLFQLYGANRWQILTKIVLPLAVPGLISAGIFAFTLSWNEFIYALTFVSSSEIKTVPVGVVTELVEGDVYHWGSLMAGALLGSLPVAFIYSFFVEYYVSGLTGSVKE